MKRLSDFDLKEKGFTRFNYTTASIGYLKDKKVITSYGLPIAVFDGNNWISANGLHNYSPTTAKQITQITGINSKERKEKFLIISYDDFENMINELLN